MKCSMITSLDVGDGQMSASSAQRVGKIHSDYCIDRILTLKGKILVNRSDITSMDGWRWPERSPYVPQNSVGSSLMGL